LADVIKKMTATTSGRDGSWEGRVTSYHGNFASLAHVAAVQRSCSCGGEYYSVYGRVNFELVAVADIIVVPAF